MDNGPLGEGEGGEGSVGEQPRLKNPHSEDSMVSIADPVEASGVSRGKKWGIGWVCGYLHPCLGASRMDLDFTAPKSGRLKGCQGQTSVKVFSRQWSGGWAGGKERKAQAGGKCEAYCALEIWEAGMGVQCG